MKNNFLSKTFVSSVSDKGILILRVVIGISFIFHGYPKLIGGIEKWIILGKAMETIGVNFMPAFWGFCAAISEFFGGIALVTGFLTRIASSGLGFTMFIAMMRHFASGDGFNKMSHPMELMAVCIFLILTGAGNISLDRLIAGKIIKNNNLKQQFKKTLNTFLS